MTTTVGAVIKEKFNNFTNFCGKHLNMEPGAVQELQRVNELPPALLIAALRDILLPCKAQIIARHLGALEHHLQHIITDDKTLQMFLDPFRAANADQEPKIWLYLSCFVDLIEQ